MADLGLNADVWAPDAGGFKYAMGEPRRAPNTKHSSHTDNLYSCDLLNTDTYFFPVYFLVVCLSA